MHRSCTPVGGSLLRLCYSTEKELSTRIGFPANIREASGDLVRKWLITCGV